LFVYGVVGCVVSFSSAVLVHFVSCGVSVQSPEGWEIRVSLLEALGEKQINN